MTRLDPASSHSRATFLLGASLRRLRAPVAIPGATREEALVAAILAELAKRKLTYASERIELIAQLRNGVDVREIVAFAFEYHARVSETVRRLAPLAIAVRLHELEDAENELILAATERRRALIAAQESLFAELAA